MRLENITSRDIELKEFIFKASFLLLFTFEFLRTTQFNLMISNWVKAVLVGGSVFFLVLKLFIYKEFKIKNICVYVILAIVSTVVFLQTSYGVLLELSLMVILAEDVQLDTIVKVYVKYSFIFLVLTFISTKIGLIEDLTFIRLAGGTGAKNIVRHAFGTIYPTDFSQHVFYLVLSYVYLKKGILNLIEKTGIVFVAAFVYYYCYARLDTVSLLILLLLTILYPILKTSSIFKKIAPFSLVIGALISTAMSFMFSASSRVLVLLNHLLSSRLSLAHTAIEMYGIKPFGQFIEMTGFGGTQDIKSIDNYFFIDSSYIRILLCFGIITMVIIFGIYTVWLKKNADVLMLIIFTVIAINTIVVHHFIDFVYNPFLLVLTAKIYRGNLND